MRIANPIYDAVFKYLLEDKRVAKLLLSTILDEEILDINIQPTEHSIELERPPLTVYRNSLFLSSCKKQSLRKIFSDFEGT
jgi:hypothetical protein